MHQQNGNETGFVSGDVRLMYRLTWHLSAAFHDQGENAAGAQDKRRFVEQFSKFDHKL